MKTVCFLLLCCLLLPALSAAAETSAATESADAVASLLALLPESWEGWITLTVTVCAAVSACWPRPADDAPGLVRLLYTVVNALGCNAGKARNADDAAATWRQL